MKPRRTLSIPNISERGQALVLFSLFLVVLLGVVALAVDGGYAFAQRRQMQYAADAAAIAGARALALNLGTAAAERAIAQYATANGAERYAWRLEAGNRVRVWVGRTFPTFFAPVMGITTMTAVASADATFSGARRTDGLLPIAVEIFPFEFGRVYTLWDASVRPAPGNIGWLDWNGGSASARELADNICNPENSGAWNVGAWVPSAQGVKASALVRNCLNRWVGRVVKVVLYDAVEGRGHNTQYRIAGFACFRIVGFSLTGKNKFIQGRFEPCVTGGQGGGPDLGMRVVTLGPPGTDPGVGLCVGDPSDRDDRDDEDDDRDDGDDEDDDRDDEDDDRDDGDDEDDDRDDEDDDRDDGDDEDDDRDDEDDDRDDGDDKDDDRDDEDDDRDDGDDEDDDRDDEDDDRDDGDDEDDDRDDEDDDRDDGDDGDDDRDDEDDDRDDGDDDGDKTGGRDEGKRDVPDWWCP